MAKQLSQITRLTPTVSITMAPSAIRGAFSLSQSIENWGYPHRMIISQVPIMSSESSPSTVSISASSSVDLVRFQA